MNKKFASLAIPTVIASALVFGLVGCDNDPSDDFKQSCKSVNGNVKRENEILGMDAVAFNSGKGGGAGSKGSRGSGTSFGSGLGGLFKGKSPKKTTKPKSPKKSKSKQSGSNSENSNDWVCVKDGIVLFEES